MKAMERSHLGVALCTLACLGAPVPRAQGQPEYRVINIVPDETLEFGETRRLRLNNYHEVVGTIVVNGDEHAFGMCQ